LTGWKQCSYFVLMESRGHKRRFPPPWTVGKTEHGYVVKDASGVVLASVYGRDDLHQIRWGEHADHLAAPPSDTPAQQTPPTVFGRCFDLDFCKPGG
jgi:hypothetical protein